MDFFYDQQIRRYLLQFMRAFSEIRVRNGPDANGLFTLQRVPILYGDPSRMAAQIAKGVSENTLLPSPMFSAYIKDIKMAPARRQDPMFVAKSSVIEREFDKTTGTYKPTPGYRQDIEMYMPVPYDLTFVLDVWTTNITTKLQIFEQLAIVYNPSVQLQQNTNLQDWTSIFKMILENITWSSRTIPQGEGNERDVMTFEFKIEAWITPPARVKKSTIISQIVTNVYYTSEIDTIEKSIDNTLDAFQCMGLRSLQIITTEGNHKVSVYRDNGRDVVKLLGANGQDTDVTWDSLIQRYGAIVPNITKMRLKLDPNIEVDDGDIIGHITVDPADPQLLTFSVDIDTLPASTIPPINDIIDPIELSPGDGLPLQQIGQRYLITSQTSAGEEPAIPYTSATSPWGQGLIVYPDDVIEYDGVKWRVIFNSREATVRNYVINNSNGAHYTYDPGHGWTYTYYGTYAPGYWRVDDITAKDNDTP